jgi:SAM-dependent methyltransferase
MKSLSSCALMDMTIDISWKNDGISHQEHYFAHELNCWRDVFPGSPIEQLIQKSTDAPLSLEISPGELVPAFSPDKIVSLPWSAIDQTSLTQGLKQGRFYPQGILSGLPGIFKDNLRPFRCIEIDSKGVCADLNHPMAAVPVSLNLSVQSGHQKTEERGGSCRDWMELAFSGPGMQTRYGGQPTDYLSAASFDRKDRSLDTVFYKTDRFVHHVDSQARQNLSNLYNSLLKPGQRVLDLMAGWESHFDEDLKLASVHGIGLNKNELEKNNRLSDHTLQDLNTRGDLLFQDHEFDAVVCSLSIEYLIDPVLIFKEVARVLKPGGIFMVTFSNRWFPEKVTRIWEDLHDFERMGLVTEYFRQSGAYDSISTISMRGYPRPCEDRYFPRLRWSDPIFAVSGKTLKGNKK